MIKVIIIEDEERSRDVLRDMLTENFHNVSIAAICKTAEEGRTAIESLHPDLVFSDIELGNQPVFNMLQQLAVINFEIIFITAYERYAIQAIKFSALDYLLKPFTVTDLTEAIKSYEKKQNNKQSAHQLNALFHNLRHIQKDAKKIALPTINGLEIIPMKEIIRCQSDVNYTYFFLNGKIKLLVAKTLKEFEEMLDEYDFVRVHNSHLVNLHHVKNYIKGEGGVVIMSDGSEVEVSRRKKDVFLKRLKEI